MSDMEREKSEDEIRIDSELKELLKIRDAKMNAVKIAQQELEKAKEDVRLKMEEGNVAFSKFYAYLTAREARKCERHK